MSRNNAIVGKLAAITLGFLLVAATVQPANAESNITAEVLKRGVLRIATVSGNMPYSGISTNGDPEGYDVEIGKALAAALKVKPEFIVVDSPGRITALQTHKADVAVANFTATTERSTAIAFTEPYLVVGVSFLVLKNSPIKSVEELNASDRKIASPRGSTADQTASVVAPKSNRLRFETVNDAMLAVKSGQADAQVMDSLWAAATAQKDPELRALPGIYSYEEVAIGLPSGDFDWWRVVNSWVHQFNNSGENAALFKKFLGFDMPPLR